VLNVLPAQQAIPEYNVQIKNLFDGARVAPSRLTPLATGGGPPENRHRKRFARPDRLP
jgi:hypothetical protein